MNFTHPLFLILLLIVPLLWRYPRRLNNRWQGWLRTMVFALLILALSGPVLITRDDAPYEVLILDESASLGEAGRHAAQGALARWLEKRDSATKSAVVLIDDPKAVPLPVSDANRFSGVTEVIHITNPFSTSSLGDALEAAGQAIPLGSTGTITLVSDGLSTDRRWGPAVQTLIGRGIRIESERLPRDEDDLYPARLRTEPALRVGQSTKIVVAVVGRGRGIRVRLSESGGEQLAESPEFDSEGRREIALEIEPRAVGFKSLTAEVRSVSADSNPANNRISSVIAVNPPTRVLYLGERTRGGARQLSRLLGPGFEIEDGSGWVLDQETALGVVDLVVIDDRMSEQLPVAFQERLVAAVRDEGLGLLYAGGSASFGSGGFDGTPLAKSLPVEIAQQSEKTDPSTALAVVIDTSGSMRGQRMDLAKQVARLSTRQLTAQDRVGIVEFYGNKQWALPLQSAADKISIDRALGRMQAGGGTVLLPAIEEALYALKNAKTRFKHILVITDGGIESADFEALLQRIVQAKIAVSTVLVGPQAHNQSLMDIAAYGRGRFYSASDRYALPQLQFKEPSTTKLPEYKAGSFAVAARGRSGWWGEVDPASVPPVSGFVETRARARAEVLVEVADGKQPVLATWRYGLGSVTALMTEPVGPGSEAWRTWDGYGRWLARVLERTANDIPSFMFSTQRTERTVIVKARRYAGASDAYPIATILPSGKRNQAEARFAQLAPDYFEATVVALPTEEIRLSTRSVDGQGATLGSGNLLVSNPSDELADEAQVDPALGLDLEQLSAATSGQVATAQAGQGALRANTLWWPLALLALIFYLSEIIYRRLPGTAQ
ncbi:VWA domain-containing protein [Pseudoxanthomonas putridarboris]|uniref:VWA domain-containing protein n=2 Tax=Pseudoxanthomonas putridarboris TaxID=752605 RepID=A0ABU9IVQ5_9GAMM